ncbi:ankyrin repeat domain-containing protein [Prosthecobacter sp.]|uniref:ankyrin repeat domain-containing protein n=1 Tax=Prosthecobacter sp. TaxID=1965333 RepID=UPI003783966E
MRTFQAAWRFLMCGVGAAALLASPAYAQFIETWKPEGIWKDASIGKIGYVRRHLSEGVSINARDRRGYTPLLHALNTFQKHIIADLLAAGADANARDYDGVSALALACRAGDAESAQLLLKAGARPEAGEISETDAFALALKSGSTRLVEVMLNGGADPKAEVRGRVKGPWPVLVYAARESSADVVELLVRRGIPVDTPCRDQSTPLQHAALFGNMATIKRLHSLGANLNALDKRGANALRYAAYLGREPAFAWLLKEGVAVPDNPALWLPAVINWGNEGLLQQLTTKGVVLPPKNPVLVLAEAARRGDLQAVNQALEAHYKSFRHEMHCTLFAAAAGGNVEVMERLNQFANEGDHLQCSDGAKFNQLHHAVMAGQDQAVEYCLKHKVNLEVPNCRGHTPLMLAALLGRTTLVERLTTAGARLDTEDLAGLNALDLARLHNHAETIAWLEKRGLKPSANQLTSSDVVAKVPAPPPSKGNRALPAVTAAALPFVIQDDTWYPSVEAARDFGLALQTGLQEIEGVRWVERAEIEKAEAELVHGAAGLLSPGKSMGIGQWVKADLLITGRFEVDEGLGRELILQVVEAHRGDVLAERRLLLPQTTGLPLTVTGPHLEKAGTAAQEAIGEARSRLAAAEAQRVFAPLFICNRTTRTNRLDAGVPGLLRAIHRGAAGKEARILNLMGSDQAAHESELAVSGLTQAHGEAWKGVADHYLWGWCEETGNANTPFAEMPVRIVFELWSGGDKTQSFSVETRQGDMEAAAEKLAAELITAALAMPKPQPANDDRLNAARILFAHARELIAQEPATMRLDRGNRWLVTRWELTMRALEAARFFAPEDPEIAATWLLERWYDNLQFPVVEERIDSSSGTFWRLWHRKLDWDEHVARFGLEGLRQVVTSVRRNDKVPFTVFQSAKDAPLDLHFQMNEELYTSVLQWRRGFPDGVPTTLRRKWCDVLARSSADCLLRALAEYTENTTYDPKFVTRDLEFFLPLEKRVELAQAAWRQIVRNFANPVPAAIIEKRLELLHWFDEAGRHAETAEAMKLPARYFSDAYNGVFLPLIQESENVPPPGAAEPQPPAKPLSKRLPVPLTPVSLPKEWALPSLQQAACTGNEAVVALTCELNDRQHTMVAEWSPKTQKFTPVAPFPQQISGELTFLVQTPDSLWVGGPTYGIGRQDRASKQFTRFTDKEGLPLGQISHAVRVGDEVYVAGTGAADKPMLAAWSTSKGWRPLPMEMNGKPLPMKRISELTSFGSRLYCLYQPLQGDTAELFMLDAATKIRTRQPVPTRALGVVCGMWADEQGLWILNKESISWVAPTPGPQPLQTIRFPEDIRINVNVPAAVNDGDWLWLAGQELMPKPANVQGGDTTIYSRLLAIHKPTRAYRGCIDLPGNTLVSLIVTPDAVYPMVKDLSAEDAPSILKLDKAALIREALK